MTFTGFGKFQTQHREARMGVNPRNPTEKVHIPAARVPKFSAGSALKAAVKSGSGWPTQGPSSEDPKGRRARPFVVSGE